MIDKERWKKIFVILTLVIRAESDFIGELQVSIQNLQATVDKISMENAKTIEKFDQLQSDLTIMKEANSKAFENVDEKFDQLQSDITIIKEANSKAFENVDEKFDQLKDDMKSQSSRLNTNLERSFDEKFSSTSLSISSLNKMIQTIEGKIEAASDVIFLVREGFQKKNLTHPCNCKKSGEKIKFLLF